MAVKIKFKNIKKILKLRILIGICTPKPASFGREKINVNFTQKKNLENLLVLDFTTKPLEMFRTVFLFYNFFT